MEDDSLIKKYDKRGSEVNNPSLDRYNSWKHYSYLEDRIFIDLLFYSYNNVEMKKIEKAVIAFFDTIYNRKEDHYCETRTIKELKRLKDTAPPFLKEMDENDEGWFDESIRREDSSTRVYNISFDIGNVWVILFFNGDLCLDTEILDKAFLNFSEKYLQEINYLTI